MKWSGIGSRRTPRNKLLDQPLTVNQAMVLLDVYRGTFETSRHTKTIYNDLSELYRMNYLTYFGNEGIPLVSLLGRDKVKEMLG